MKKVVLIVVLLTVVWFIPDRPMQMLKALREVTKALGPGDLPSPTNAPLDGSGTSKGDPS
jgi:hypothetical protein